MAPFDKSRGDAHALFAAVALVAWIGPLAGSAAGHVVLSQTSAPAGGAYVGYFRVMHGCAGSPTTSLRVEIPPGVLGVKPKPKPGWTLRIEHAPLPQPAPGEVGRIATDRVSAISWTGGPLPDDQWDEFGISARLPATQGSLYFPTVQTCVQGATRWVETPSPGEAPHGSNHPAPLLHVGPAERDSHAMEGMAHDRPAS